MHSRAYYLSLLLFVSFVIMLLYVIFQFSPDIAFLAIGTASLVALIIFIVYLKGDKKNGKNSSDNQCLPFPLQKSRILRIIFATVALALIVSAILAPVFILIFGADSVVRYVEIYFEYHILGLSVLLFPIVIKYLK